MHQCPFIQGCRFKKIKVIPFKNLNKTTEVIRKQLNYERVTQTFILFHAFKSLTCKRMYINLIDAPIAVYSILNQSIFYQNR